MLSRDFNWKIEAWQHMCETFLCKICHFLFLESLEMGYGRWLNNRKVQRKTFSVKSSAA